MKTSKTQVAVGLIAFLMMFIPACYGVYMAYEFSLGWGLFTTACVGFFIGILNIQSHCGYTDND